MIFGDSVKLKKLNAVLLHVTEETGLPLRNIYELAHFVILSTRTQECDIVDIHKLVHDSLGDKTTKRVRFM